jgi:hypothetical protein
LVVVESDDGGKVKGRARLVLQVSAIEANGRTRKVQTNTYTVVAKGTKKEDAMKIGIGSGVGAAIGAIAGGGKGAAIGAAAGGGAGTGVVLATKGDPATIPAESVVKFRMSASVRIS